jgi:hypothetical protein
MEVTGRFHTVEVDSTGGTPDESEVFAGPMTDVSNVLESTG